MASSSLVTDQLLRRELPHPLAAAWLRALRAPDGERLRLLIELVELWLRLSVAILLADYLRRAALLEARWLRGWRLCRVLGPTPRRGGGFRGRVQFFVGGVELELPQEASWTARLYPEAVYLLDPAGAALLGLSPFLVVRVDERVGRSDCSAGRPGMRSGAFSCDTMPAAAPAERGPGDWLRGEELDVPGRSAGAS